MLQVGIEAISPQPGTLQVGDSPVGLNSWHTDYLFCDDSFHIQHISHCFSCPTKRKTHKRKYMRLRYKEWKVNMMIALRLMCAAPSSVLLYTRYGFLHFLHIKFPEEEK